jgi:hypothetical protein
LYLNSAEIKPVSDALFKGNSDADEMETPMFQQTENVSSPEGGSAA